MVNTIFILDKNLKTYKVLTVNGKNSFFNDIYTRDNETSAESFEFSTNIEDISESEYVMFLYHDEYKLFQIIDIEQEHNEGKIIATIYGEGASLELLNSVVRPLNGEFNAKNFFEQLLEDTEWELGIISDSLLDKVVNGLNNGENTFLYAPECKFHSNKILIDKYGKTTNDNVYAIAYNTETGKIGGLTLDDIK